LMVICYIVSNVVALYLDFLTSPSLSSASPPSYLCPYLSALTLPAGFALLDPPGLQ